MSPVATLTFVLSLVATLLAAVVFERVRDSRARVLVLLVGLVCVFLELRLLRMAGLLILQGVEPPAGLVDLLIAALCLAVLLLLQSETYRHRITRIWLRLAQANEKLNPVLSNHQVAEIIRGKPAPPPELQEAVRASPLPVVVFDAEGRPSFWNKAATRAPLPIVLPEAEQPPCPAQRRAAPTLVE